MTTSREAFEKWCMSQGYSNQPSTCWQAWQAGQAALLAVQAQQEPVLEGYPLDIDGDPMPFPPAIPEDAKDAERYRWLRGKSFCRGESTIQLIEEFGGYPYVGETKDRFIDRYIDAAIAQEKP